MSDFTKPLISEEQRIQAKLGLRDIDCMDAYDFDLLLRTMERIQGGEIVGTDYRNLGIKKWDPVEMRHVDEPPSDSKEGESIKNTNRRTDILIVEGCYMLCNKKLVEIADVKVFVDLNADARLGRIVLRDTEERKVPLESVFNRYLRFSKRAFEGRIEPTMQLADVILPRGPESAAIDLIAMGIWDDITANSSDIDQADQKRPSIVRASYSPAPKPISLVEVDLERFYDPI